MTDGSEHAPAGWYDDPHQPERMRYFDGRMWTNHFHQPGRLPDIGSWLNTTFAVFGGYWQGAAVVAFVTTLIGNLVVWSTVRFIVDDLALVDEELVNFGPTELVASLLVVVFVLGWQGFGWLSINRYLQRAHFQAEPSVRESFVHAARRLPRYVVVMLGVAAVVMLVVFLVIVLTLAVPLLGVMALLGLAVGSIWVFVKLSFLVTALAIAPRDAPVVRTSADVSTGRFWAVLGRILLITVVLAIGGNIVATMLGDNASTLDAEALSNTFEVDGDSVTIRDVRFRDLLPSDGQLVVAVVVSSLLRAATTLISTSALVRLYLDSGAPSEL